MKCGFRFAHARIFWSGLALAASCLLLLSPRADALVQVGHATFAGDANDLAVEGGLAYVAADGTGVSIFDVADPTTPTALGSFATVGPAVSVDVAGTIAVVVESVTSGDKGLRVLDVSNPSAPASLGYLAFALPGATLRKVELVGSLAYVVAGSAGLLIVDVSTPSTPVLHGSFDSPGEAWDVHVVGGLAYLADAGSGLRVIDVSTPSSPAEIGSLAGYLIRVRVNGDVAYGGNTLRTIDVSNPGLPVELGSEASAGSSRYGLTRPVLS